MILIISTCKEKIHELEFVKPIEKLLKDKDVKSLTKNYKEVKKEDIQRADRIIITGTSLDDNEFLDNLILFQWIKTTDKPILGICAGMQIISIIYGAKIRHAKEIGYYKENFIKNFLGLHGVHEVYHLHNNYVTVPAEFESFTDNKIPQAIKHNTKDIYGVLFHPEVRKEKVIDEFIKI